VALRVGLSFVLDEIGEICSASKGEKLKSQLPIPIAYCTRGHSRVSFFSGFLHDSTALAPHMGHRIGSGSSLRSSFSSQVKFGLQGYLPRKGHKVAPERLFRDILNNLRFSRLCFLDGKAE
jgi:hypothetical protein